MLGRRFVNLRRAFGLAKLALQHTQYRVNQVNGWARNVARPRGSWRWIDLATLRAPREVQIESWLMFGAFGF